MTGSPLRIAWGGPLREGSAIGREGVRVAEALAAQGHAVRLIATDLEWGPLIPRIRTELPISHYLEVHLGDLRSDYDSLVVNVGDHFPYHAGVFPLLEYAPGVAIIHDMYLGNLFNGWIWAHGSKPGAVEREMVRTYGPGIAEVARRLARGELSQAEQVERAPMTEWVARLAAGCLAHAPFYVPRMLASCAGPVDVASLPVASRGIAPLPPRSGRRITVVTVGNMNPNKCADRVIEAIGSSPELRERVEYRLVGAITLGERVRLRALADRLGFGGLSIEGPADERTLDAALTAADIIVCLRRPVLEGASGSAIEALMAGRPTIVADTGFYASLPTSAAAKVPADIPVDVLRGELERLAADEPERRALGERARAYAEGRFRVDRYIEVLEPLMRATAAAAPVLRLSRNFGSDLAELGLTREDPAVARIGASLQTLFGAGQPSQGDRSAAG